MATPYNIQVTIRPEGAQSGGRQVENALDRIEQRMRRVQALAVGLFSALAVQRMVREVLQAADAYTQLQNRLRVVTTDAAQLAVVQGELFDLSQRTRTEFSANVEMYARLNLATRELGVSSRDLLDFQENLNKALIVSGASASEARSGIFQLSQAMAKGRLDGDELRSVLENIPIVADLISKSLGVTRGELRRLGEQGKLTSDVVFGAVRGAGRELTDKFGETVPTVAGAWTTFENSLTNLVGRLDQMLGISRSLAIALTMLSRALDGAAKALPTIDEKMVRWRLGNVDENIKYLYDNHGDPSKFGPDQLERLAALNDTRELLLVELDRLQKDRAGRERAEIDARIGLDKPGAKGVTPPSQEQERYAEILRRTNADLDRENELLRLNADEREVVGRLLDVEEKMQRNKTPILEGDLDKLEARFRALQQLQQLTRTVGDAFGTMFKGMEDSLVSFATTGRFEFRKFADSVVADLVRIMLQAYVTKPLLDAATGGVNSWLGGNPAGTTQASWNAGTSVLPGFASGADFMVGGRGGTDSQVVAFRASPNERVRVTTPGQEMPGRASVQNNIVINNHSGAPVETQESTAPDGSVLTEIIIGTVRKEIGGGGMDSVLGARFGTSPTKKRR